MAKQAVTTAGTFNSTNLCKRFIFLLATLLREFAALKSRCSVEQRLPRFADRSGVCGYSMPANPAEIEYKKAAISRPERSETAARIPNEAASRGGLRLRQTL